MDYIRTAYIRRKEAKERRRDRYIQDPVAVADPQSRLEIRLARSIDVQHIRRTVCIRGEHRDRVLLLRQAPAELVDGLRRPAVNDRRVKGGCDVKNFHPGIVGRASVPAACRGGFETRLYLIMTVAGRTPALQTGGLSERLIRPRRR